MGIPIRHPCDEAVIRSAPADSPCARRAEPWVLAATILGSSLAFIDGTAVNVALPILQSDLRASVAGAQWVVESYGLLLAAMLLPGGSLGDRFGRRRVFAAGIAIFALASALCGLAPGIGSLIAARAVQGAGAALLVPASLAIIGASFPAERRGRAIGTWSAFSALTMALGPVLGGWLTQSTSWRAVFYINLPLAAVVLAILYARVPESRGSREPAPMDWPGTILAVLGLGGVVYGLIESARLGWSHPAVIGGLVGGSAALAAFVAVEARSPAPMMPLGLFRSRLFSGVNLLTLLLYGALSAALFFLPFNLLQVQGYTAAAAGAALLPLSALLFLLSRWSGGLVDRFGARGPLIVGPLLAGVGMAAFALPGIGTSYWVAVFPAVAVLGLGMAVTVAPLTTSVLAAVETKSTGVASGVNNAVSRVGGLLAIALLGIFMQDAFDARLDRRLAEIRPPASAERALEETRGQLAAIVVPPDLSPGMQAAIREAIAESFVAGYRRVMLLCAGLAAAGAGVARITIRRGSRSD